MITKVYSNVSMSKLNCMRRECRRMMKKHADMKGYKMTRMMFPPGNKATWYCSMRKGGMTKEMMMRVYRDRMTNKLMMQCNQDIMSDAEMRDMMDKMYSMC